MAVRFALLVALLAALLSDAALARERARNSADRRAGAPRSSRCRLRDRPQ